NSRWTAAQVLAQIKEQTQGCVKLPAADKRTLQALAEAFPDGEKSNWGPKSPLADWPAEARQAFLYGTDRTNPPLSGIIPALRQCLEETEDEAVREAILTYAGYLPCPECGGARLNREARSVRFAGKALHEVTALTVDEATAFFEQVIQEPADE